MTYSNVLTCAPRVTSLTDAAPFCSVVCVVTDADIFTRGLVIPRTLRHELHLPPLVGFAAWDARIRTAHSALRRA